MSRNLYGLMIKYPEPGKVKTRLAKDIGLEKAAEIYRQVAELVSEKTVPIDQDYRCIVFFDPPARLRDFEKWIPGSQFIPQQGADVGDRMDNAIRELLALGAEKAVITGADIPGLNREIIERAFASLDSADIVIGPAGDGGYYLIGMKQPHGAIFRSISWSTEKVLEQTVKIIKGLHLTVAETPVLPDIDRAEDLAHFPQLGEPPHLC